MEVKSHSGFFVPSGTCDLRNCDAMARAIGERRATYRHKRPGAGIDRKSGNVSVPKVCNEEDLSNGIHCNAFSVPPCGEGRAIYLCERPVTRVDGISRHVI